MTRPKLSYFDFDGGRGEDCRLALHTAGVEFDDDRLNGRAWRERKASTPFGALPVLEVEGKGVLAQSNAILSFIGRNHELLPSDGWEAARHESLLAVAEDLRNEVNATTQIKDADAKKAAREALARGYLARWADAVEAQVRGPFVGGDEPSVADFKLYVLMRWFKSGGVDHISPEVFDGHAKLSTLFAAVDGLPTVRDWYERRKKS